MIVWGIVMELFVSLDSTGSSAGGGRWAYSEMLEVLRLPWWHGWHRWHEKVLPRAPLVMEVGFVADAIREAL